MMSSNNKEIRLVHEPGRWQRKSVWSDSECLWLAIHAMTLQAHYDNPTHFYFCCGFAEALEAQPIDYDRIRGWITEHTEQVRRLLDFYVIAV